LTNGGEKQEEELNTEPSPIAESAEFIAPCPLFEAARSNRPARVTTVSA
jgi:hypothetical protein